jgi:cobalt/nickel transport system ATP-binding protein
MEPIITLSNIEYAYPHAPPALSEINLSIQHGEKIALVGSNGAGKSTLLLTLNGMIRPNRGIVTIQGTPIQYDRASLRQIRQKIGFVFQDPDVQIIAPTVWQDVAFGPVNLDYSEEKVQHAVPTQLHCVGLRVLRNDPPTTSLEGKKTGRNSRRPLQWILNVLVLDEPTSMLDPGRQRRYHGPPLKNSPPRKNHYHLNP